MDTEPGLTASQGARYAHAVRRYVLEQSEDALAAAGQIGRELMQSGVAPEELAELHETALRQLALELPSFRLADAAPLLSAPLTEMLMAYGLAFREQSARRDAMETRLRQAEKMEAIGTFAAGIAHDFNNIVGAIIGFTEMSLDDVEPDGLARHNLQQVLRSAARARDQIAQILAFSRQDEPRRVRISCATVVREALSFLKASIPPAIELRARIAAEGWIAGTGLGLSVVYAVVQACGGTLSVTSEPGSGARFDVYLPRAGTAPEAAAPAARQPVLALSDTR